MTFVQLVPDGECPCCGGEEEICDGHCSCAPNTITATFAGMTLCCPIILSRFSNPPGGFPPPCTTAARWLGVVNTTFNLSFRGVINGACTWCATGGFAFAYLENNCNVNCAGTVVKDTGFPIIVLRRIGAAWDIQMYLSSDGGANGPFFDIAFNGGIAAGTLDCEPSSIVIPNDFDDINWCNGEGFSEAEICGTDNSGGHSNYVMAYGGTVTLNGSC